MTVPTPIITVPGAATPVTPTPPTPTQQLFSALNLIHSEVKDLKNQNEELKKQLEAIQKNTADVPKIGTDVGQLAQIYDKLEKEVHCIEEKATRILEVAKELPPVEGMDPTLVTLMIGEVTEETRNPCDQILVYTELGPIFPEWLKTFDIDLYNGHQGVLTGTRNAGRITYLMFDTLKSNGRDVHYFHRRYEFRDNVIVGYKLNDIGNNLLHANDRRKGKGKAPVTRGSGSGSRGRGRGRGRGKKNSAPTAASSSSS